MKASYALYLGQRTVAPEPHVYLAPISQYPHLKERARKRKYCGCALGVLCAGYLGDPTLVDNHSDTVWELASKLLVEHGVVADADAAAMWCDEIEAQFDGWRGDPVPLSTIIKTLEKRGQ